MINQEKERWTTRSQAYFARRLTGRGMIFPILFAAAFLIGTAGVCAEALGEAEAGSFLRHPDPLLIWVRIAGAGALLLFGGWVLLAFEPKRKVGSALRSLTDGVHWHNTRDLLQTVSQAIDQSPSIVVITDASGAIEFVNPRFRHVTGYCAEEVRGKNPRVLRSGVQSSDVYLDLWKTISEGRVWRGELQNRRKDGTCYWEAAVIVPVVDEKGRISHYLKLAEDISERKEAEETIRRMIFYDRLTGLAGRELFVDRLTLALSHARRRLEPLAVIFLDLDHFQKVTHSLGHGSGDDLLRQVAARLTGALRSSDTVARLGSDIFTVLLPQVADPLNAGQVAQKLLDAIGTPFSCGGHEIYMSASVGISVYPEDGEDATTLLRNADAALSRAKQQGSGTLLHYAHTMNERAMDRMVLENSLRKALDRQEFILYYQPQMELATGRLFGAEALIRWRHPERGLVPPGHFIPLAEETGLIVPIGEWVVPAGCAQLAAWKREGADPLRLAVNLSARQFHRPDLVPKIQEFLAASALDPAHLTVEITESALMHDLEAAGCNLKGLKDVGVNLAIDDFGTGHASLVYLKRFPIDLVKIDRSFVAGVDSNPNDAAIVSAVIAMAHQLGIEVLAEGVERKEQLDFLRSHRCDKIQGYLLSPPVPAEEFALRRTDYASRLH